MAKNDLLNFLKDINFMYNDCGMYDSVSKMLEDFEAEIRAKAIDEFAERVKSYVDCGHLCNPTELRWSDLTIETMIDTIAEQLKEEQE